MGKDPGMEKRGWWGLVPKEREKSINYMVCRSEWKVIKFQFGEWNGNIFPSCAHVARPPGACWHLPRLLSGTSTKCLKESDSFQSLTEGEEGGKGSCQVLWSTQGSLGIQPGRGGREGESLPSAFSKELSPSFRDSLQGRVRAWGSQPHQGKFSLSILYDVDFKITNH